ncbi:MAG: hypothetical protein LBR80_00440 [Deltaproteobacteria bacterium]|jgi:carbonic anhydrase|nr:hypothetical protein [Deltaproteobacteria bacterium]
MYKRIRFTLPAFALCLVPSGTRAAAAAVLVIAFLTLVGIGPVSAQDAGTGSDSALSNEIDFSVDESTPALSLADPATPATDAASPGAAPATDAAPSEAAPATDATPPTGASAPAAPSNGTPAAPVAAAHAEPADGHAAPSGHGGNPWNATSAMTVLTAGNARFVGGGPSCRDPQAGKNLRHELATEGQTPLAAILSCSDSRAPVEDIFDLDFGDIFSIRAAGSVPGIDQLGSIEYAVAHLGVPLVVVLAHTKCGAVTAAVQGAHEPGNLGELLHKLDPISQAVKGVADADKINAAVYLSAKRFSEQLPALSPVIKEALDAGKVTIVDAVYDIDTGQVHFHP